ncbi:MAG: heavy metal translocating P-type ATPase [Acidobacteriota bacterium]|nr:heavy metal translocating P-type ATPase [Acidobacteriota bacterium]
MDVRVLRTGHETRVGQLMQMVETFARDRPSVVRLADRVAEYFVVVVLSVAAATALLWAMSDVGVALEHAITLLIVTCPCALGLATPLAMQCAIGQAAHRGILVKGGDALEQLAGRGRVWLDKTGTLTRGRMEVADCEGDRQACALAAIVERGVSHPIATALVDRFVEPDDERHVTQRVLTPGGGVHGTVAGQRVHVGSPSFVRHAVRETPLWAHQAQRRMLAAGLTPVWVAVDAAVAAVLGIGDVVRPEAIRSLDLLRAAGFKIGILSGDHPEIVARVAAEVGVPAKNARGGLGPEEKARIVRQNVENGESVVMVGDGVNDAAALAAASVGVAVRGGAEASLAASDVFLTSPGLAPLVRLIDGSRRTMTALRTNVIVSLLYNLIAAGLAVTGVIDPRIAAILMPISSLTVVGLSYRRMYFEATTCP